MPPSSSSVAATLLEKSSWPDCRSPKSFLHLPLGRRRRKPPAHDRERSALRAHSAYRNFFLLQPHLCSIVAPLAVGSYSRRGSLSRLFREVRRTTSQLTPEVHMRASV